MSVLSILDFSLSSDTRSANIFSHSIGCLFILFISSFTVQKLFRLLESHSFIFVFIACAFGVILKNHCQKSLRNFSPMFFSGSFMGSGLISKSLINFELIFVSDVTQGSISLFYM